MRDPEDAEPMGPFSKFPQLQYLRIPAHDLFGTSPSTEELFEHSNDYLSCRFFTSLPSGLKELEVWVGDTWSLGRFVAFIGGRGGRDNDAATWRLRQQEYLPHLKTIGIYVVMKSEGLHGNRSELEALGIKSMRPMELGRSEIPNPFLR